MIYGLRNNTIIWRLFVSRLPCTRWLSHCVPTMSYGRQPTARPNACVPLTMTNNDWQKKTTQTQVSGSYLGSLTLEQWFILNNYGLCQHVTRPEDFCEDTTRCTWRLCTTIALQTCSRSLLCALHSNVYTPQSKVEWRPVGYISHESLLRMDLSNLQIQ